jgi:hypothetical protein
LVPENVSVRVAVSSIAQVWSRIGSAELTVVGWKDPAQLAPPVSHIWFPSAVLLL